MRGDMGKGTGATRFQVVVKRNNGDIINAKHTAESGMITITTKTTSNLMTEDKPFHIRMDTFQQSKLQSYHIHVICRSFANSFYSDHNKRLSYFCRHMLIIKLLVVHYGWWKDSWHTDFRDVCLSVCPPVGWLVNHFGSDWKISQLLNGCVLLRLVILL